MVMKVDHLEASLAETTWAICSQNLWEPIYLYRNLHDTGIVLENRKFAPNFTIFDG